MKHADLSIEAQSVEIAEKIDYLRSFATPGALTDQTRQEMEQCQVAAHEGHAAGAPGEAASRLAAAHNLYFDLYPHRREIEEQLLDDHAAARGRRVRVLVFNVWHHGAVSFDEMALEPPTAATIEDTDTLTLSWDASDGEEEAFCIPIWRVNPDEPIPGARAAAFVGIAGIHRSINGRVFNPSQSEEPDYK